MYRKSSTTYALAATIIAPATPSRAIRGRLNPGAGVVSAELTGLYLKCQTSSADSCTAIIMRAAIVHRPDRVAVGLPLRKEGCSAYLRREATVYAVAACH